MLGVSKMRVFQLLRRLIKGRLVTRIPDGHRRHLAPSALDGSRQGTEISASDNLIGNGALLGEQMGQESCLQTYR